MYKVVIKSLNEYHEIEWEETFKSISLRGARSRETRWLKKQLFDSSVRTKDTIGTRKEIWWLQ